MTALCWNIGREVAAAGLGLDISGAVFLALGLMASPSSLASLLFSRVYAAHVPYHELEKGLASAIPLRNAARAMLQGRVGLVCLTTGFLLQLIGISLPGAFQWSIVPMAVATTTIMLSRWLGVLWIRKRTSAMMEGILHAPVVNEIFDLKKSRYRDPSLKWKDTRLLQLIRRMYS